MKTTALLHRMKTFVEEQDHLLDKELQNEKELKEIRHSKKKITETKAYKRLTAGSVRKIAHRHRHAKEQGRIGMNYEEKRGQESGRDASGGGRGSGQMIVPTNVF